MIEIPRAALTADRRIKLNNKPNINTYIKALLIINKLIN